MQRKLNIRYIGLLLTFALGAAALVSCEKDPEGGEDVWNPLTGDTPVRIRTSVTAPVTKVTGTAFDNGDQIGIFGFYHNGSGNTDGSWDAETSAGTNIPDYMFNQRMTYNGSTSVWDYSPTKYWPNENKTDGNGATSAHIDKLSFWGYYPYGGSGISFRAHGTSTAYTNATAGLPDVYFTQSTTPASQVDFMTSDTKLNLYKGMDKGVSDHYGNLTDGEVDLTFHHRLTRTNFEVKKEVTGEASLIDYTVTITSITLTNLYETATYTPETGWSAVTGSSPAITLLGSPSTIVVSESVTNAGSILAIPQALNMSSHEVTLNVNYTLVHATELGNGSNINPDQEAHISLKDAGLSAPTTWSEGMVYTYTITFHNQGLYLKVSAAPWDNAADFDQTTTLESNLYIQDEAYLRYDEDGDFDGWTDSFAAVADGAVDGKLRSPLLRLVTTSDAPGLKLISDNSNFRFRQYNNGTGAYAEAVTELAIPAGEDVYTYYCVVPKDSTLPEGDAAKANIYLVGASGLPYLPYNASVFPGNVSNTSCQFIIVSASQYDANYEAPYSHFKPEAR